MSRPPSLPVTYPEYGAAPPPTTTTTANRTMAETQTLPSFAPSFLSHDSAVSRQAPARIQLPPLTIPQPPRPEYKPATTTQYPATQPPPPQIPLRAHHGPAAPLDKLLSPQPYTPPRSDVPYSPNSPPRSAVEFPAPPMVHRRAISERYGYEDRQAGPPLPSYLSPVEQRAPHNQLASPVASYAPPYAAPHQHYRHEPPPPLPHQMPAPAPPYHPHGYHETGPVPPPPRIPAQGPPPPQIPQERRPTVEELSPGRSGYTTHRESSLQYDLTVRQQPKAARACGFGERDRRVIDPPPIIQLTVSDKHTKRPVDLDELRYSLNVVHCTLWNADGTHEETALVQADRRATRRLMGQLVASPSVAKDEHDNEGCFFCFPDLSCRTHGKYRLRFVLMRIDPANLHVGGTSPILTEVLSDVFTVYTAKDFPGMRSSSALTRALKLQGCNIQVKKGNEKALARKRSHINSDDGEDDDDKIKRQRAIE